MRKEACERYQNLSEEKKDKRRIKTRERYQDFSEEQKGLVSIFRNVSKIYLSIEEIII